jgi:predicted metallo-beta-lactamase superfamily hydrolase
LVQANPYQLNISSLDKLLPKTRVWLSSFEQLNNLEKSRFSELKGALGQNYIFVDSLFHQDLCFSKLVFHGERDKNRNKVFMTRIEEDNFVFVHGSDIQLLDEEAVQIILSWKPDLLVVSGPPLYLTVKMTKKLEQNAFNNARILSDHIPTVIIDHHLLRNYKGLDWLGKIKKRTKNKVLCAACYMNKPLLMLEADRLKLYKEMSVTADWHTKYAQGLVNTQYYWDRGNKIYHKESKTSSGE